MPEVLTIADLQGYARSLEAQGRWVEVRQVAEMIRRRLPRDPPGDVARRLAELEIALAPRKRSVPVQRRSHSGTPSDLT